MILPLLRLLRPYYTIPLTLGLTVIVSYITAADLSDVAAPLVFASASLFSTISAAYILNDLCDTTTDIINNPSRPLPSNNFSLKTAFTISIALFTAGLMLALFTNIFFFIVILTVTAALIAYDLFSKRLGLLKAPFVSLIATSLYPMAFAIAPITNHPHAKSLYIFPFWFFTIAVAYEILKDIRDIKGDRTISHTTTWPISAARIMIIVSIPFALMPALLGYCKQPYLIASIIASTIVIAAASTTPRLAIKLIYIYVFTITAASYIDLLIFINK